MEQLILSFSNYKFLAMLIAFLTVVLETFLPLLPLLAIVMANSFVLGMWLGFFISWMASSIASIILYLLANKFSKSKYIKSHIKNEHGEKIYTWIKNQGFNSIFISYACPFIPDFLITVVSGVASVNLREFILGMISGKFVMFLLISYIGEDISDLFNNPFKIVVLSMAIIIAWLIGKNINNKIKKG